MGDRGDPATGQGEVPEGPAPDHHNQVRLHSAIGYIAPIDKLLGKEMKIFKGRGLPLKPGKPKFIPWDSWNVPVGFKEDIGRVRNFAKSKKQDKRDKCDCEA